MNITLPLQTALTAAETERSQWGKSCIDSSTLILGILQEATSPTAEVLISHGLNISQLRIFAKKAPQPSRVYRCKLGNMEALMAEPLVNAVTEAGKSPSPSMEAPTVITVESLFQALLKTDKHLRTLLKQGGLNDQRLAEVETYIADYVAGKFNEEGAGNGTSGSRTPTLDKFTTDLVALAREGKLSPVIGRLPEISKTIQILGRKSKNNPVLIGEAGVGKTAILEGIAQRIADGHVPSKLKDKRVLQLDLTAMLAGTEGRGGFEARLVKMLKEIKAAGNIILFIDELHTLLGAGGPASGLDAANALKPELVRGHLTVIGATTTAEYRKYIENRDAALVRRFRAVTVEPPSVDDTVQILHGLREGLEKHHNLTILDAALSHAAELAERYVSDRFQPDKSIDLVDEAASMVAIANDGRSAESEKPVVTADDIATIVSMMTGIPVSTLNSDERARLLGLENFIHQRVIGQNNAVSAVARAVRRGRSGIKDPRRPGGFFLFLGPTGVGKTELAKALQQFITTKADDLVRLDMSEFMEAHSVSKLIGAPPGYVGFEDGGKLTEAVRRKPYSVVLLDEIEKAHPDVYNLLLQMTDAGRLTDGQARTVDFRNTIIVMTANIGARTIQDAIKNKQDAPLDEIMKEVRQVFSPELINRIDEVICFHPLHYGHVEQIRDLLVDEIRERLPAGIMLELEESAKDFMLLEGYAPEYGARPMRRALTKYLEDPIADTLLAGKLVAGDTLVASEKGGRISITIRPAELLMLSVQAEPDKEATQGQLEGGPTTKES